MRKRFPGSFPKRSFLKSSIVKSSLLSCLLVLASGVWLSGCSTVEGAGKDLQKAGEAISGAARNASS
ncbi:entericidin A/B family lipoprotein [Marinobacterium lutimaris]|uniref:Predicted small secreted protein n=1 Tax=Marinobacterium lutimaris TaxID=568106 RepID=A0A1H5X8X1_9GAMM|nr:entericidin A/B family lipoprotein [Marinobacterium lutimaris]SEG07686.1 Predicted small secreted protein [Marinobacterium lutimaris]